MSIQCRTCAEKLFNTNAKNLFEQDDNEILMNIEILTGIQIYEDQQLPKYICTCCYVDLYHSIVFRERCIRTEKLLQRGKEKAMQDDPLVSLETRNLLINSPKKQAKDTILKRHTEENDSTLKYTIKEEVEIHETQIQCSTSKGHKERVQGNKIQDTEMLVSNVSQNSGRTPVQKSNKTKRHKLKKKLNVRTTALRSGKPSPSCSRRNRSSATEEATEELTHLDNPKDSSVFSELEFNLNSPALSPADSSTNVNAEPNADEPLLPDQNDNNSSTELNTKEKSNAKSTGESKVFVCDLCGLQSSSTKNLEIHILRHKGEKNFECEECGIKHYSKYLLKLHIRVKHKGEMPFECRHCGQRFYSGSTRTRHEQVHHVRNFAYACKICGKKYNTKTCLNKHVFLHTGLRPHRCDLCNVAFPRKPGLKIHYRTKLHQKRASEALNKQLDDIKELSVPDASLIFPDSIIEELDV